MPLPTITREIRLVARPSGWPTSESFDLVETPLVEPGPGEVLVRNLYMSVDPYMRGRMNDAKSYVPPFALGAALEGGAVGEVIASRADGLEPGTPVLSDLGWREHFVAPADAVHAIDPQGQPLSAYLGVLGMPGLTAWIGLRLVDVRAGDRVWVSAAAGAVGSVAGQLARQRGCFVVGSAGSEEKRRLLVEELGFDDAVNYKDGRLTARLHRVAPDGFDVYFDNVGGDHLEAALSLLRPFGRIIACGAIARYNDTRPEPGPRNLAMMIVKRLTMKGFIVSDHLAQRREFAAEVGPMVADGRLRLEETVVDGLENAPRAFIDLLGGGNIGKMIVRLG